MAELENIAPSRAAWLDKWEHIEGAVLTHMFGRKATGFSACTRRPIIRAIDVALQGRV